LFFNAAWALTSGGFCIVSDTLVINLKGTLFIAWSKTRFVDYIYKK